MLRKELKWYVASWLGGFDCPIFVAVNNVAYTKNGSSRWSRIGSCLGLETFVSHVRHAIYA